MKFTAEDFANRLAGGMDKHAAVDDIKKVLTDLKYKCKIQRRQTATGNKIYFVIEHDQHKGNFCITPKHVANWIKENVNA